jgi:serine/threonine protein kinase
MKEILNRKIFFKKYKVKKLIFAGPFSSVYEGINELTKESVAMKFETKNRSNKSLELELFHLMKLQDFGIPKIISFGKNKEYNILIEELLGPSIDELFNLGKKLNKKVLLKAACMIAIQSLDRLQFIHSKNFIHRDIKPSNLLIGNIDKTIIYLIDFGLSGKYRSDKTGKHIQFKHIKKAFGTFNYMSLNSNKGYELSRRDDLESLGYSIIDLIKNYLPWSSANFSKLGKIYSLLAVLKIKQSTTPEKLCEGLPEEFLKYIKYVKKLLFE